MRWLGLAVAVLAVWMAMHALVFTGTVVPPDTYLYAFYLPDISGSHAWEHFPAYVYELRDASAAFLSMLALMSQLSGMSTVELAFIPAGVAVVLLSYVLARCFTGTKNAALIALLAAVYPYGRVIADSFFSRMMLGAALALGVLLCYFRWMEGRERGRCLLVAALLMVALGLLYYTVFYVVVILMTPMLSLHMVHAGLSGRRLRGEAGFALVFYASALAALVLSKGGVEQLLTTFSMLLTRGGVLASEPSSYTVRVWYGGRFLRELLLFLLHLLPYAAAALLFVVMLLRHRNPTPQEAATAGSILGLAAVALAFYFTGSKLPRFLEMSTFSLVPMLALLAERVGERRFERLIALSLLVALPTSIYGLTTPNLNAQKIDAQEMHACAFAGYALPREAEIYTDMKGINCLVLFGSHYNVRTSVNYGGTVTTRRVEESIRVLYDDKYKPPEDLEYVLVGEYMYRVAVAPYSVLEPTRKEVLERLMQKNTVLYNNGRMQIVKLVH